MVELVIVIIVFVALAAIVLWVTEAIGKLIGPKATWSLFLVLLPAGLGFFFAVIEKPETAEINLLLYPLYSCLLYTSPSPRDRQKSRMPSSA